jgi:uncharacterized protein Yka (UPF0111/DUF47 family)
MFRRLLPKETNFFAYFEEHNQLAIEVCREFLGMFGDNPEIPERAARIFELEQKADRITHQCTEELHKTFITSLDRSDILLLIKRLDDIIDAVYAASSRMELYEIQEARPEAKELSEIILQASSGIAEALKGLRNIKNGQAILEKCIAIHYFEDRADGILRSAIARLFREHDQPVTVIKWKEIFERLEKATDRCDDVANIIEKIVMEST